MPTTVIDDSNWTKYVGPVRVNGEVKTRGLIPRDWAMTPYCGLPFCAPFDVPSIPRSEWSARIKEGKETKSFLSHVRRSHAMKSSDQNGVPYCWIHGPTNACRLVRAVNNQPYVALSATAAGCQIKNFRKEGGWGSEGLEWIVKHGVPSQDLWPENKFDRGLVTDAMKANALLHRATEWYDLRPNDFDQLMTCLFLRIPVAVGYNWWGHEVCAMDPEEPESGSFGVRIWNSWSDDWEDNGEAILRESKATPDDAVAPRVIVAATV